MTDYSDLMSELRLLHLYTRGGKRSSLPDRAADALAATLRSLSSQSLSLSEALERCAGWAVSFAKKCEEHQTALREIERLKGLVAGIREPMFPIMGGPKVPWSLIAPYEHQAESNHRQSLKQLAGRGGLSMCEAMAIMSSVSYRDRPIAKPTVEDWLDFISDRKAKAERRALSALENGPAVLADAHSNPPLSDLSSLRKGAEVVGEAAAYDFVAAWHERQAKLFREMAEDDPRTAKPARDRAKEAAIHHAASAAALRNRAADDRRAALVSGSREDGE